MASKNQTIKLGEIEKKQLAQQLLTLKKKTPLIEVENKIIYQDIFEVLDFLPDNFISLLFADPPYNISKKFESLTFKKMDIQSYEDWTEKWVLKIKNKLTKNASLYVCGDWRSSSALYNVLSRHFIVQNRITFEREKGRGANKNYKNCSEDIFFCTNSKNYTFHIDKIKLRKKVIAPYKKDGLPKDWQENQKGEKYRNTYPSNLWTDLTIPFWSMSENTTHPTQKPEKLLAKIILASSNEQDLVFDPFLGSGTTSVVAQKLNRRHLAVEINIDYCLLAQKRLLLAKKNKKIQGLVDGVFWDRNLLKKKYSDC